MTAKAQDMSGTVVLGRYRVVQPLARGGMGIVYLARTEGAAGFTRPVVIKRIVPDLAADEAAAHSFVREARILANLQHPDIVNVIDFDEEDGAYVMVLEYVHGYNVGQWHKYVLETRRALPVDYALYIMTHVLDALHYAHTFTRADGTPMQIVHRDVSPGNILIDTQGHVKLLDFGIARANEGGEYKTRDGFFKGKLAYAAPEVYEGTTATPRSDVYSAGVVLYQLLAGENPFRGKDMPEIIRRVLTQKPPPLSSKRDDVGGELDAVIAKALAKNPDERYATALEFADALRAQRTRSEEEILGNLGRDVLADFNGDLPAKLGLEPLQKRDAAWRAAVDSPRAHLSSTPPPLTNEDIKTVIQGEIDATTREDPATGSLPPGRRAGRGVFVVAVGAAALGVGAAALFLARREAPPERPKFVLVEKQTPEPPATPSAPPPLETAAAAPDPSPSAVPAPSASAAPTAAASSAPAAPRSSKPGSPDPVALSRDFQRQRGRIEACFRNDVTDVDGRPEVSVRFRVGTSGHVEAAELAPAALGATPLGQCLLGVARSTQFSPVSEPVSFTIPITARRVK